MGNTRRVLPRLNIIVPVYNEQDSLVSLYMALHKALRKADKLDWHVTFVDDHSTDSSLRIMQRLARENQRVQVIALSKNFGKEIALTAGLHASTSEAVVMMDADLQHPPRYLPKFISLWRSGAQVVVGVRQTNGTTNLFKRLTSKVFYALLNQVSDVKLLPQSTDYRLLDQEVVEAFKAMREGNRITRGMIDWLGFDRAYVSFDADERVNGKATYSLPKLLKLASDSFISMTRLPLKVATYLGSLITVLFGGLGLFMFFNEFIIDDGIVFSGPASLAVLILFLVGIILINIGFVGLYIANINEQVKGRPLYVVNERNSRRTDAISNS